MLDRIGLDLLNSKKVVVINDLRQAVINETEQLFKDVEGYYIDFKNGYTRGFVIQDFKDFYNKAKNNGSIYYYLDPGFNPKKLDIKQLYIFYQDHRNMFVDQELDKKLDMVLKEIDKVKKGKLYKGELNWIC